MFSVWVKNSKLPIPLPPSPPQHLAIFDHQMTLKIHFSCVSGNSSSTFWWTSLFDDKCYKIQAICTVCAKSTCQFHTMCFNTVTTDARLHLGPIKLWRHDNDCIYMKIWVPLLGKTTQVPFVAKMWLWCFCRHGKEYLCVSVYSCRRFVWCCLNFFSSFGMWLCFVIDLPQFFVFLNAICPSGWLPLLHMLHHTTFHTICATTPKLLIE